MCSFLLTYFLTSRLLFRENTDCFLGEFEANRLGNISKYFSVVDWINIDDFEQVMLIGHVKSFIEAYLRLDKLMMEY